MNNHRIIATLRLAISTIEGLVDQQAMASDWYEKPLSIVKDQLTELEKEQAEVRCSRCDTACGNSICPECFREMLAKNVVEHREDCYRREMPAIQEGNCDCP